MPAVFAIEITGYFVLLVFTILIFGRLLSNVNGNFYYCSDNSIEND